MTRSKSTRAVEAPLSESTQASEFPELLGRLLDLVHHVQLVDQRLYDLQDVPEELQPAATVLHDATEGLDALYNELDSWATKHVHVLRSDLAAALEGSQLTQVAAAEARP